MAHLENGIHGRTVHNCSVYDATVVWEVTALQRLDVVQSTLGGEVERTGQTVEETRIYHLLAPADENMVKVLWAKTYGNAFRAPVIGEAIFKPLFTIDGRIDYSQK